MDNSIIEKVRKLLTLAQDKGANENEASLAASRAQKLMMKHNISEDAVEIHTTDFGEEGLDANSCTYEPKRFEWDLLDVVAKAYLCKTIRTRTRDTFIGFKKNGERKYGPKDTFRVIGHHTNRAVALSVFKSCQETFRHTMTVRYKEHYLAVIEENKYWVEGRTNTEMKKYLEDRGLLTKKSVWISSYLQGCLAGLRTKLEAEQKSTLTEEDGGFQKYALIKVKHTDLIDEYIEEKIGKVGCSSGRKSSVDPEAFGEGRKDGYANSGQKMIG